MIFSDASVCGASHRHFIDIGMARTYALTTMSDLRFDLEDDVSVTELRELDRWQRRLAKVGKLRVQRRGEVVGVLLSPAEWKAVKAQIEDARDRSIVASRSDGALLSGKQLQSALERELKKARLL